MSGISRDDWLRALDEAVQADGDLDPDALTVLEFAQMCGIPSTTARRRLDLMVEHGKAERVRKRSAGRIVTVTAYRLMKPMPRKRARA